MSRKNIDTRGIKTESDMIRYNTTSRNRYEAHLPKGIRLDQLDDISTL